MLYALEGKVFDKQNVFISIDVNGVVFSLIVSPKFAEELEVGAHSKIFVNMILTEEEAVLYGFKTPEEREAFRRLIKLQGVGPNLVFRIMSAMDLEELLSCLEKGDVKRLSQVKGVGPKRAERIIFESQGLMGALKVHPIQESTKVKAIAALVSLGLKETESAVLVDKAMKKLNKSAEVDEIIRLALGGDVENN
ncbi:MAG TPA: Holliday junction branch migration protein RuvA [Candidatus Hydrothermia bacterium]|mgnify:CR=1 FL=1|nr:Holliday junction branch migration protein RuvA [Candidatus Hydrothermae bacterium]MDD5573000.1 Holliday junction branch migration protein RuvA [Candidatus Hydrothermia bacterium]HOP32162.1 Holliday junction branch migration protein RuvA [Candidatus Hydrothermia bacterium]HRD22913.1 Holliday junction branch migration protein RuvA [Candidatus Hydrothermia bacterium]